MPVMQRGWHHPRRACTAAYWAGSAGRLSTRPTHRAHQRVQRAGDVDAVPILEKFLKDPDENVRQTASDILEERRRQQPRPRRVLLAAGQHRRRPLHLLGARAAARRWPLRRCTRAAIRARHRKNLSRCQPPPEGYTICGTRIALYISNCPMRVAVNRANPVDSRCVTRMQPPAGRISVD